MRDNKGIKVGERRKKRMLIPAVYFVVETIFVWLILSLIEVDFNIVYWNLWSMAILGVAFLYSISKTFHVYHRQRDYPES